MPAIGIGLSSNDLTPNFLFTYRHRDRQKRARQVRTAISAACIGLLAILLCGFLWQEHQLTAKAKDVARLSTQRDAFNLPLTQELIMALYARVSQKRSLISDLSRRYHASAVIAEVSRLTPDNVRLIALRADVHPARSDSRQKTEATLTIEGIVTGEKLRFEADLTGYLFAMAASPLFHKPIVKTKRLQFLDGQQSLRFAIQFSLV